MNTGEPGKFIASAFALAGFAVALVAGLTAGNSAVVVIKAGLAAMFICYFLGMCIGAIAQNVIHQHLAGVREGGSGDPTGSSASLAAIEIGGSAEATS